MVRSCRLLYIFVGSLLIFFSVMFFAIPSWAHTVFYTFRIGSTTYLVNDKSYQMDVAPFISNGRVYVPIRYLAYALNISDNDIVWDPITQSVTLTNGKITLSMRIGSTTITVNGNPEAIDVPPLVVNGRTMLPARWVVQPFGAQVDWIPGLQNMVIETIIRPIPPPPPTTLATGYISSKFSWSYGLYTDTWTLSIPNSLLQYNDWLNSVLQWWNGLDQQDRQEAYSTLPQTVKSLIADSEGGQPNLVAFVNDDINSKYLANVVDGMLNTISADGYAGDKIQEVNWVAAFVQSIPYNIPPGFQLAATTLARGGDCKAKSVLLAGLLKQLGFQVALLAYPASEFSSGIGHMAVGVALQPSYETGGMFYYRYNGSDYFYIETTMPTWFVGQMPNGQNDPLQGIDLTNKQAFVFPVQ